MPVIYIRCLEFTIGSLAKLIKRSAGSTNLPVKELWHAVILVSLHLHKELNSIVGWQARLGWYPRHTLKPAYTHALELCLHC